MLEETRTEITIAGVTYDLKHLAPKPHKSPVMLPGEILKPVPVQVAYTMHCFTRGLRTLHGETIHDVPATHVLYDGKEPRVFCERRYVLSLQLPKLMEDVLTQPTQVHSVRGGNYVRIELVEELADGTTTAVTYFIILQMRKSTPDEQRFIKIRVETAYPEDLVHYQPTVYDPKGLKLEKLLRELWTYREGSPKPGKKRR